MIESPIFALFFLIASGLLTGSIMAIQRIGKGEAETIAKRQKGLGKLFFHPKQRKFLSTGVILTKFLLVVSYAIAALGFAFLYFPENPTGTHLFFVGLVILGCGLVNELLFLVVSRIYPHVFFKASCQIISFFLFLLWIFIYPISKILEKLPSSEKTTATHIKDKILEILQDLEIAQALDPNDQKLILSFLSFKERIAREVMVPRIDIYTLSADTSIKEAAKGFIEEGYSRIPVWKESVDNIIGTLYYKDLFNVYFNHGASQEQLEYSIEKLLKPLIYAPETKKISQLLQVFLNKQIHLAIVVDEYGGTEGIVTIEDILEELVGEIADEYDYDEEALFTVLPSGGWIVDAKMTILDIEDELGIKIPQSPEYDTIGGFIFHKAGAIPSKGWKLHQDDFDLEVLSSSEKTLEKIRILPR